MSPNKKLFVVIVEGADGFYGSKVVRVEPPEISAIKRTDVDNPVVGGPVDEDGRNNCSGIVFLQIRVGIVLAACDIAILIEIGHTVNDEAGVGLADAVGARAEVPGTFVKLKIIHGNDHFADVGGGILQVETMRFNVNLDVFARSGFVDIDGHSPESVMSLMEVLNDGGHLFGKAIQIEVCILSEGDTGDEIATGNRGEEVQRAEDTDQDLVLDRGYIPHPVREFLPGSELVELLLKHLHGHGAGIVGIGGAVGGAGGVGGENGLVRNDTILSLVGLSAGGGQEAHDQDEGQDESQDVMVVEH